MRYFTTRVSFQRNSSLRTETTRNFFHFNYGKGSVKKIFVLMCLIYFSVSSLRNENRKLRNWTLVFFGLRIIFPVYGLKTGNIFFWKACKEPRIFVLFTEGKLEIYRFTEWKISGFHFLRHYPEIPLYRTIYRIVPSSMIFAAFRLIKYRPKCNLLMYIFFFSIRRFRS